ncbi:hypothetical protein [Flavobacterium sp.]|uniref:hypothetical protein n=1 Tax=Flavobacterium sp. TaxID=239 RepID=UPI003A8F631D
MKTVKIPVSFLVAYSAIVSVILLFLLVSFKTPKSFNEDEISLKRINITDEQGNIRLVISNEERTPPPILNGKEYKRAISPAGMIFYDKEGNECGGLALSSKDNTDISALVFDYSNMDALGMRVIDTKDGDYNAGFIINDPSPKGTLGRGNSRILLENSNGDAQLVLHDAEGSPRLKISVDEDGNASFNLLDKNGKVTKDVLK